MDRTVVVGAIGSCRVHVPLQLMSRAGKIDYRSERAIGYLHSPLEIMQGLRLLRGEIAAPPELALHINIEAPHLLGAEDRFRKTFGDAEMMVIEISSLRVLHFRGWHLQKNRFQEEFAPFGFDAREVGRLFDGRASRRTRMLERLPPEAPELVRDFLNEAEFYEQSDEDVTDALRALRKAVPKPVLFVGIPVLDATGTAIRQRDSIRRALTQIAQDTPDTAHYDPTEAVFEIGFAGAMKDLGHYHPEFEPELGRRLVERIHAFRETAAA